MGRYCLNASMAFHLMCPMIVFLDEDGVRYLYVCRHNEDENVVPYNSEIAILWSAAHNVQIVSKHGSEMYLAKYISKSEPSLKIELPEKCSDP